jgi:hypothetical protein
MITDQISQKLFQQIFGVLSWIFFRTGYRPRRGGGGGKKAKNQKGKIHKKNQFEK